MKLTRSEMLKDEKKATKDYSKMAKTAHAKGDHKSEKVYKYISKDEKEHARLLKGLKKK